MTRDTLNHKLNTLRRALPMPIGLILITGMIVTSFGYKSLSGALIGAFLVGLAAGWIAKALRSVR